MRLNIGELTRLLEYVPKETAPDLHKKILGALTAYKYVESYRSLKGDEKYEAQRKYVQGLSEYELLAWQAYSDSMTTKEA